MIQDIYPHQLNNQYNPQACPDGESRVFLFRENQLLLTEGPDLYFPKLSQLPRLNELVYFFSMDGQRFFMSRDKISTIPEGFAFQDIHKVRKEVRLPKENVFAMLTAKHLMDWYRDNQYCGRCGHKTEHSKIERAKVCPQCGYTCYPRIMPAVIVGVTNGDQILITRYNRAGSKTSALIAGFTEIGETLEETVAREVKEEAGLKVKNIRYYKSQPWGIANDILAGFYCDVDGDDSVRLDDNELSQAVWTKREDIIPQSDDYSLTNEMMVQFKLGNQ